MIFRVTFFFCLLSSSFGQARRRKNGNKLSRDIVVENQSGVKIDFMWINPLTRELAPSNNEDGLVFGAEVGITSYVGHSFEVQEMPVNSNSEQKKKNKRRCKFGKCRKAYFKVNSNEDQSE